MLVKRSATGSSSGVVGTPETPRAFPLILDPDGRPAGLNLTRAPFQENPQLRQALSMSGGEMAILARGWVSTGLLLVSAVVLAWDPRRETDAVRRFVGLAEQATAPA